jgi:hypothetical protein
MTRTEIINGFIRRRRYRSYLEIGCGTGHENFDRVDCENKHGVDPAVKINSPYSDVDSDTFFEQTTATFDLIFIDGMHEESQVDRDIVNALTRLNPAGVIILHDCLPPDEWHQRPVSEYRPGENWNGTVWKSVLKYFALSGWCCYVVDCDWGCGVIDTAHRSTRHRREFPVDLDYRRDFAQLGEYVIGEGRFIGQLYNVTAFYHVAALGNWKAVVAEHFQLLSAAGLDAVRVSYVGCLNESAYVTRTAAEAGIFCAPICLVAILPSCRNAISSWSRSRQRLRTLTMICCSMSTSLRRTDARCRASRRNHGGCDLR